MSDCSTHAFDVPMSNRYTHRFGDAQWHEPKKYDEFPGMKRIERIAFTDGTMLDVDYPFVAADREIERVEVDGVAYVDGERMLKANGEMCAEVNRLQAKVAELENAYSLLQSDFDMTRERWMMRGSHIAKQRDRIEELERHECPCHDGKGYVECVAFRYCDEVTKKLADRQMHELAKLVVAESMPIYESIEDARTRRIADLEELIADMRGEMRPFERDVFLLRYIDKRIAELGIEV